MNKLLDKIDDMLEYGGVKKDITLLVISGISLVISIFDLLPLPFDAAWIAIILCGIPIILEAFIGLVREFDITADVLVAIALIASVIIGEDFAAGEVAFIMQLGELLEELTVARARAGIEKLVNLTPRIARVINGQEEKIVKAEEVTEGDTIRILPGESIPVDGTILRGVTSIDESVMTGESMPVDKGEGDQVKSGTVNRFGSFDMLAEKVGEDSSIRRMIRLVESADAGKAKIVTLADKWAVWVVIAAVTASIITYLFTHDVIRAVTILVVFCPCALVLATPTAIMAGIGNATRHGMLVKEGDALERLSMVNKVTFDKTGTLTYGTPEVVRACSLTDYMTNDEIYKLAASVETRSEHPLGKAIIMSYKAAGNEPLPVEEFDMRPGKGVSGIVEDKRITVENAASIAGIDSVATDQIEAERILGHTVVIVTIDGETCGMISLADTVRDNACDTISDIKSTGTEPVLLTGDNEGTAKSIANDVGIEKVKFNLLPEDKLSYIKQRQEEGEYVCMIGDGINDAPALKIAHVGIAMGGVGSDIAVDAADIAIVNDDIKGLPHLMRLSKHMMRVIKANLTFSMLLNFLAIALAITGVLGPVTGALVHNAGSFFVILNSSFLLTWNK